MSFFSSVILTSLLTASTAMAHESQVFVSAGVFHAEIEGPAMDQQGNLYAVNFGGPDAVHKGTIGKVSPDGTARLHLRLPAGSVGNGIRFDQQGIMYIADYTGHNIWRYDGQTLKVHSHQPLMFQPNDLAITQHGILFASDPDWKNKAGQLWKILPDGQSLLLEKNMGTTNGIEVSPDQQRLYVNESAQRRVWVYDLDAQAQPSNKRLLIEFADFGLDGMRCDRQGNLFVARYGKGVIAKISPEGQVLQEFALQGKFPTNVTFSNDFKWLYVTMQQQGSIEKIQLID